MDQMSNQKVSKQSVGGKLITMKLINKIVKKLLQTVIKCWFDSLLRNIDVITGEQSLWVAIGDKLTIREQENLINQKIMISKQCK